tara:strand:+ start:537 stop:731 length:195 start_codon:yes stop_codon:yes gene_type:complete
MLGGKNLFGHRCTLILRINNFKNIFNLRKSAANSTDQASLNGVRCFAGTRKQFEKQIPHQNASP